MYLPIMKESEFFDETNPLLKCPHKTECGEDTDSDEFCWEVNCDKCGKICDKKECPFDTGYDENEKFICDNCGEDTDSDDDK